MIKTIIFDIGQVLAKFRWREYIEELGYSKEVNEKIAKATVLSSYWNEVDRGVMTTKEIIESCVQLDIEIEDEIRNFFENRKTLVVEFDYAKDWVCELKKKGYHIYILSNYGEDNFSYVKNEFQFLKYVDGAVISYQEKCIKPDPKIYETLLNRYNLTAKECVFIDDLPANIAMAKQLGIQGIVFTSLKQAKKELQALGVEV